MAASGFFGNRKKQSEIVCGRQRDRNPTGRTGARVRKRILRDKWTERQIFYRDRTLPYEETL